MPTMKASTQMSTDHIKIVANRMLFRLEFSTRASEEEESGGNTVNISLRSFFFSLSLN